MLTVQGGDNELLDLFTRYNHDLWPAHVVAYAIAVTCIVLVFPTRRLQADRAIRTLWVSLWAWLAMVFRGLYAIDVDTVLGLAYAALFLTQALLLMTYRHPRTRPASSFSAARERASASDSTRPTVTPRSWPRCFWSSRTPPHGEEHCECVGRGAVGRPRAHTTSASLRLGPLALPQH
jgi:hypothetical protein